jgi:hypothetical protein
MNENEKNELEKLNDNPVLLEAIRKILFSQVRQIEDFEKELSEGLPDERLGEITRGQMAAVKLLKEGFKEIANYKKVDSKLEENNIAI